MVMFEVHVKSENSDVYANRVALLKRELVRIDGFVDQTMYRSLTRDGWLLSVSTWRDEKAVVRWRTQPVHSRMQHQCRSDVLVDYHLRVGQLTHDTALPNGLALVEQRLDVTEVGEAYTTVLINAPGPGGLERTPARWPSRSIWVSRRMRPASPPGMFTKPSRRPGSSSCRPPGATRTPAKPTKRRWTCPTRPGCVACA